jgi:SlyX protein
MTENSLNRIEETLAHQEQKIQDLSDMVTRQWDEIDILKKRLNKMQDKMAYMSESAQPTGEEGLSVSEIAALNKPPHY